MECQGQGQLASVRDDEGFCPDSGTKGGGEGKESWIYGILY